MGDIHLSSAESDGIAKSTPVDLTNANINLLPAFVKVKNWFGRGS